MKPKTTTRDSRHTSRVAVNLSRAPEQTHVDSTRRGSSDFGLRGKRSSRGRGEGEAAEGRPHDVHGLPEDDAELRVAELDLGRVLRPEPQRSRFSARFKVAPEAQMESLRTL